MELNGSKRSRRLMIAKLMPFCKAVKPDPSPYQDLYNNVHYASSSTTSYAPQPDFSNYAIPPRLSFLIQPSVGNDMEKKMEEKLIKRGINGLDESVDVRAATYISSVRERFKLDHCEGVTTTLISLDHQHVDH